MERFKKFITKDKKANDGVMPNYVHGKHAENITKSVKNDGVFPNYVHGNHAAEKKEIKETREVAAEPKQHKTLDEYGKSNKEFRNPEHMDKELGKHYDTHIETHPEVAHVERYTSSSRRLNRGLLAHHKGEAELPDEFKEHSNGLSKVVSSIPAPKEFHTYSGLGFDPRRHVNEKGHLHSPAFLSSSPDINIAGKFSKEVNNKTGAVDYDEDSTQHILKVKIPKDSTHGAYVNGSSSLGRRGRSHGEGEKEFIIDKAKTFKIDPNPTSIKDKSGRITHMIHHATIHEGE